MHTLAARIARFLFRTRPVRRRVAPALSALTLAMLTPPAHAWDGHGHRIITRVAMEGLDPSMPAWLRAEEAIAACEDYSRTPDRWRGVKVAQLKHINDPDHYIDIEDLAPHALSLRTMPQLRHEYVKAIAAARAKPDFAGEPIDAKKDFAKTLELPGLLPISTMEAYAKVVAAFRTYRIVEAINQPSRQTQLTNAKWNAYVHIGILSHFVGDAAQPLHTTRHYNGWIGDNPQGFTTDKKFHAYIDGGVLAHHKIREDDLRPLADFARTLSAEDLWNEVLTHIERSHAKMVATYEMQKSGALQQQAGKSFIVERLGDASGMLSALIEAAWIEAAPTPKDLEDIVRFEGAPDQTAPKPTGTPQPPAPPAAMPSANPGSAPK
jgi:hypothetical protein